MLETLRLPGAGSIRCLFFTDTHYNATSPRSRKDDLMETNLKKLEEILELASRHRVDFLLHGGDFDERPDVTDLVASRVAEFLRDLKVPLFVVPGGHDLYGNNLESLLRTKLGLFAAAGLVRLLTHPSRDGFLLEKDGLSVQVTGTASHVGIDVEGIEDDYVIKTKEASFAIHVVHGMLVPKPFLPGAPAVLVKDITHTLADLTLAGHYHLGYDPVTLDGKTFYNPGAIVRKTADLGEMKRRPKAALVTITAAGIQVEDLYLESARPAEEVLDRSELERVKEREATIEGFLAEIRSNTNVQSVSLEGILRELAGSNSLPAPVLQEALLRIAQAEERMGGGRG